MDETQYRLRKLVKMLEGIHGRHTELVTVYVPAGYNLQNKINQLGDELGTAGNIQSKTVRTNVTTAIERMITALRKYKQTPPNGLAAFSGNISEIEGKSDYQVFILEPPNPIKANMYRCDQQFVIEPLKDMLEAKNIYGLVVVDLRDAAVAILRGHSIVPVKEIESFVMGKFKAGGQSAARFHRVREGQIKNFMKKIAVLCYEAFRDKKLAGIIVGGPGPTKEELVNEYFVDVIKKQVVAIKDIGYTGESGLRELVNKSEDILIKEAIVAERKLMEQFLFHMAKDDGFASYGEAEVLTNLEKGTVASLLISEAVPEDKIEKFTEIARTFGTEVNIISTESQEGNQLKELGGFAAVLRYKV